MKAATTNATTPCRICVSRVRIVSRTAAIIQKRLFWKSAPKNNPATSEIISGACIEPGPFCENLIGVFASISPQIKSPKIPNTNSGNTSPTILLVGRFLPRENPRFRKNTPIKIPKTSPNTPAIAVQSPALSLSHILQGQPKKTSAPIIANMPSIKRTIGAEPARGRNSLNKKEAMNAPKINPITSGRMYCTIPAWCKFNAPAISRVKHAAHIPILPGFPKYTSTGAKTPSATPARIGQIANFITKLLEINDS